MNDTSARPVDNGTHPLERRHGIVPEMPIPRSGCTVEPSRLRLDEWSTEVATVNGHAFHERPSAVWSLDERGSASTRVTCIDPLVDASWSQLLDRHGGSVFLSPTWLNALVETYGFELRAYVVVDEDGQPRAGVPFCRVDDIRGRRIVILPFSDYCDPVCADHAEWRMLADALRAEQLPLTVRWLRSDLAGVDAHLAPYRRARWHGIDLEPDLDSIWRTIDPQSRQRIRRAQRDGVTIRIGETEGDLRTFFEMHTRVRKYKYRLLPQSFEFFVNIWRGFRASASSPSVLLLLADHRDQTIAGTLFLRWQDTLYYKFNASNPEFLQHRPNDLIIWEAIVAAKDMRIRHFDFGLSDWDQEGLVRFKSQYATAEAQITSLNWKPERGAVAGDPQIGDLLSAMTALLTDPSVPDDVTEKGGALLYRFFA